MNHRTIAGARVEPNYSFSGCDGPSQLQQLRERMDPHSARVALASRCVLPRGEFAQFSNFELLPA